MSDAVTKHYTKEWWTYVPAKTSSDAEKKAETAHKKSTEEIRAEEERYSKEAFDKLMDKARAQISQYNGSNIDPSLNYYSDKRDGRLLNDNMIDSTGTDDAIIYESSDGNSLFELVPASRLESKTIVGVDEFNMVDAPSFEYNATGQDGFQEMDAPDTDRKEKRDLLQYSFGLDEITASRRAIHKVSGFVSKPINIGECHFIELIGPTYEGLEYSIIENGNETPILPKGQTFIYGEKIFFGLPLRFPAEKTETVAIKAGGMLTSYRYDDIDKLQENGDKKEYTIDYTPVQSAHHYYPKSNKIQVKIIQRLKKDSIPHSIEQVLIRTYGGNVNWVTQASKQ